jgi:hypothetical protein
MSNALTDKEIFVNNLRLYQALHDANIAFKERNDIRTAEPVEPKLPEFGLSQEQQNFLSARRYEIQTHWRMAIC